MALDCDTQVKQPLAALRHQWPLYLKLIRWDKPIGTLLLLWPTLWALWIAAQGLPPLGTLVVFVLGTFLMRSAGCAINDYADREFDRHVARTAQRVVTSGQVSPAEAFSVALVLALLAFALVLTQNRLTIELSLPAVLIAAAYPFFKRFFAVPQLILGVAFSFGIPMAFAAVTGAVPAIAWQLLAANLIWTVGYDTAYAMADKPDDLKIGIKTSAVFFGRFDAAVVLLCHAAFIALMGAILWQLQARWPAWVGLAVAAALAARQAPWVLSRDRGLCFRAFLFNHWVGMAVFAGVLGEGLVRG
jgi:4-hydroxybenzoate polyprenyltransferase